LSDLSPCGLEGPRLGASHEVLELGEELLDGVQVRAVGWQEEHVGSGLAEGASCRLAFVAAEIVEDHDIAFGKGRSKYLLDVEGEELPVDGAINDPWGVNAIDPQGCDEGECLPVTVRNPRRQALSPRSPAAQRRHVGLDPGLIEEDEPLRVDAMLMGLPSLPLASDVWPILLGRQNAFF
jgi:hypothetical protein